MKAMKATRTRREHAFSLVELMAVIMIIGMLGATVAVAVMRQVERASIGACTHSLEALDRAISSYKMEKKGKIPEALSDLVPDYIKKLEKDPWDRDFLYEVVGGKWKVESLGSDGTRGGASEGDENDDKQDIAVGPLTTEGV